MTRSRSPSLVLLLVALAIPVAAAGQIVSVELTESGEPVPLELTDDLAALGRGVAHGLLATAHRDVTRPVTDSEIDALGRRGTLLEVRLARPEQVVLLRLRGRERPSRLAAYVPPERDDHAYVFLGGATWKRIVVVSLPDQVRAELRRLREAHREGAGPG
jgi:hypothetical protein